MSDTLLEEASGRPNCIAIIICSEVIEDKMTNNKTLVSLFNGISLTHLPNMHPRMFVMASFADGTGEWPFTIVIRSPAGKEILRTEGKLVFAEPTSVLDIVIEVRGLPLEEEGMHFVDVLVAGKPIAYRRFAVQMMKEPPHDPGN